MVMFGTKWLLVKARQTGRNSDAAIRQLELTRP